MPYIKGVSRGQITLLPESLDDYVAEDNPVRVIDAFINKLDLLEMEFERATPSDEGRPGYDPRDMLKLYIYGYFNKIRSSRKLRIECARNVELMWLLSKLVPDFRCIADFRKNNAKAIKLVFREFVRLCGKLDLLSREQIVIDGSKFKAVNSKKRNFSSGKLIDRIRRIDEKLEQYLACLDHNDKEDKEPGEYTKEDLEQLIQELNERKATYTGYLQELIETGKSQKSLTDPEAKLMPSNGKMDVCYNVQTAVDGKSHIIADFITTDHCNDVGLLTEVTKSAKEVLETPHVEIIADKGYRQNEDVLNCLLNGDVPNVPTFDKQDCYTFEFPKKDCQITEELLKSMDKDDIEKCICAGVLPDILKNKNVTIEVIEETKEEAEPAEENENVVVWEREIPSRPPIQEFFRRDLETDIVICPMEKTLKRKGTIVKRGTRYANKKACKNCKNKCTTAKYRQVDFRDGKTIVKTDFYTANPWRVIAAQKIGCRNKKAVTRLKVLLKFHPDEEKLKIRKSIVEHPFGTVKRWCDGSYLLVKGKVKATADLSFSFLGYNLKRAINTVGVKGILAEI
jgi:transposase